MQTINQARALVLTGPDDIRARFARHATDALVAELAALRPRPGSMVRYHTLLSLRELGKLTQFLDGQLERESGLLLARGRAAPAVRAGQVPGGRAVHPVQRRLPVK